MAADRNADNLALIVDERTAGVAADDLRRAFDHRCKVIVVFRVGHLAGRNRCGAAARVTERVDRVAFLDLSGNTEVRQRAADYTDMRDVRVRVKAVDRNFPLGAVVHLSHKAVNAVDKVSAGHRIAACAEHNAAADAEDIILVIVGVQLENRRYTGTEHLVRRHADMCFHSEALPQIRLCHTGDDGRNLAAANVGVRLEIMRVVAAREHARPVQTVHISGIACRHVNIRNRTVRNVVDRGQGVLRQRVCKDGRKLCSGRRLIVIRISRVNNTIFQRIRHIRLIPRTNFVKIRTAADIGAVQTRRQLDRLCDRQVAVRLELSGVYAVHQLVFIRRLNILRVPLS